jgi:hypothetical protein
MTSSYPWSSFCSGKKPQETDRSENICFMNYFLAYFACSTVRYLMKMNPSPFTRFFTYSRSISMGRGMTTFSTSPCRLAISLTSSII